jgi:hypothetical protein
MTTKQNDTQRSNKNVTLGIITPSMITLSIMTLSIMTLNIMTISTLTLSIMTLSIMTLNMMTLCIMTLNITIKKWHSAWQHCITTISIAIKCDTQHSAQCYYRPSATFLFLGWVSVCKVSLCQVLWRHSDTRRLQFLLIFKICCCFFRWEIQLVRTCATKTFNSSNEYHFAVNLCDHYYWHLSP